MYADDTTLASTLENFGSVNDVACLERELNQEITKVYSQRLSNKLTLNAAKAKFMTCFKVPKVVPRLNLTIAGNPIEQVNEFNFLIKYHLETSYHKDGNQNYKGHWCTKQHIFPQHILLTIYNSLIQSHLIYGLYLWGLNCKRLTINTTKECS